MKKTTTKPTKKPTKPATNGRATTTTTASSKPPRLGREAVTELERIRERVAKALGLTPPISIGDEIDKLLARIAGTTAWTQLAFERLSAALGETKGEPTLGRVLELIEALITRDAGNAADVERLTAEGNAAAAENARLEDELARLNTEIEQRNAETEDDRLETIAHNAQRAATAE